MGIGVAIQREAVDGLSWSIVIMQDGHSLKWKILGETSERMGNEEGRETRRRIGCGNIRGGLSFRCKGEVEMYYKQLQRDQNV